MTDLAGVFLDEVSRTSQLPVVRRLHQMRLSARCGCQQDAPVRKMRLPAKACLQPSKFGGKARLQFKRKIMDLVHLEGAFGLEKNIVQPDVHPPLQTHLPMTPTSKWLQGYRKLSCK